MRKFLNVDSTKQSELTELFPVAGAALAGNSEKYSCVAVSLFERRLTEDEVQVQLDSVSTAEHQRRIDLISAFNRRLTGETDVYTFRLKGRRKHTVCFKSFTSEAAQFNYLRQKDFGEFVVALPELAALYCEGYDYTNIFWFRDCSKGLALVKKLAKEFGLYCWDVT